jgi:pimeloyl-ACP methyl ester carboxylesterase
MSLQDEGFLDIGGQRLEYRMIGPRPHQAPTIVMLHEGLGCVGMWNDFPDRLAQATGVGVFVYSRAGYGRSSRAALPRSPRYMHDEALETLPRVLSGIGFRRGLLLGHSDGASIAAIYAGSVQDHRIRGLALVAPNFMVEDASLAAVNEAKAAFAQGDLRERLARWHADPDSVFRGWSDTWLDPAFRAWSITEELAYIRVPILIVRGTEDRHGTLRQIEAAQEECYCPVDLVEVDARHAPHREAPEAALQAVADFTNRILHGHGEAAFAA